MKLGLVVHAVNLPKERDRLVASLDLLPFYRRGGVDLCLITEADYGPEDPAIFNPARAKNIGIRHLLTVGCEGIVCIDADYIIPSGLFDLLAEPAVQPFHIWIRRRDCTEAEAPSRDWRGWLARPVFPDCWGSANYMSAGNWLRVGGWDERTYGWGGDDDVLHIRIGQAGIERRRIDAIPLMHVAHGLRAWGGKSARGGENIKWAKVPQPNYLKDTPCAVPS